MSKFFKALSQAERDRKLHGEPARPKAPEPPARVPELPAAPAPEITPARPPAMVPPPIAEAVRSSSAAPLVPPIPPSAAQVNGIGEQLVSLLAPSGFEAEQYRRLRATLEQQRPAGACYVVAISSPAVGDGKTTTALNLAGALAQGSGARVIVVDADFRQPAVARSLGLTGPTELGLSDAISGRAASLDGVIRRCEPFHLDLIPAGSTPPAPYETLKSPRFGTILAELRGRYDYVVVDSPPILGLSDCQLISPLVDGFLVVLAAHRTPRRMLAETFGLIDPQKLLGLVYNQDDGSIGGSYYQTDYFRSPREPGSPRAGWALSLASGLRSLFRRRAAPPPDGEHPGGAV